MPKKIDRFAELVAAIRSIAPPKAPSGTSTSRMYNAGFSAALKKVKNVVDAHANARDLPM